MASLEQELLALPELRRVTRERLPVLARALSEARIARDVAASLEGTLAAEWLSRRALAYERLRRLLPLSVDVLALIDSDGTPRTEPPRVTPQPGTPPRATPPRVTPRRVTPPRVTPPRVTDETLATVSAALEREYTRFSTAVAATTALVRECFLLNAGDTRATHMPERVLVARRASVKAQVGALDKTRTAFLEAFAAARAARDARGLDATIAIRAEDTARGAIGVLCKPDDGETFAREIAAASRCEPGEKTLPPAVTAFLRAEAPYENYRDQRIYCFTGTEAEDFPGNELEYALPPAVRATVIPRVGSAIGPDGYVVVVKEGRYIGVAYPESREKRKRRALENTSFAEALTHAAMSAVASALQIALASARAIVVALRNAVGAAVAALRSALDALLASAARWRAWLLATAIGVFGARRARSLLGALANKGVFLAARAIGRSAVYFASPVIARAAFLSSLAALVYAYRQAPVPDSAEDRARSRVLLVSAIAGLVSAYFAYPAASRRALAEPFERAPAATLGEYRATLAVPFEPVPIVAEGVLVAAPSDDVTRPLGLLDTGGDLLLGVPAVEDAELELEAPFPVDVSASELETSITSSSTALARYNAFEQTVLASTRAPLVYGPTADAATLERLARAYIEGALALADTAAAEPSLFSVFAEGAVDAPHLQTLAVSALFYVVATGLTGGVVPFLTTVAPLAIAKGGAFAGFTRAVGWAMGGSKIRLLLPDGNSTLIALGGRLAELEDVAGAAGELVSPQTWASSLAISAAAVAQRVPFADAAAVREGTAWLARVGFDPNVQRAARLVTRL